MDTNRGRCIDCGQPSRREGRRCWPCHMQRNRAETITGLSERFWSKVDASGDCWEWIGTKVPEGYGQFDVMGRGRVAHRFMWELLVGQVPEGLQLDHLCRNPGCVNPDHLEPVTGRENLLRGYGAAAQNARRTECIQGHPFAGENLLIDRQGRRRCLTCERRNGREARRRWRARQREMRIGAVA